MSFGPRLATLTRALGIALLVSGGVTNVAAGQQGAAAPVAKAPVSQAKPATLAPGSPAPVIAVKTWLKGTPVRELGAGKTYVIEFWASWNGPSIDEIPHLNELARQNPDVIFLGVSVWEDRPEDARGVRREDGREDELHRRRIR